MAIVLLTHYALLILANKVLYIYIYMDQVCAVLWPKCLFCTVAFYSCTLLCVSCASYLNKECVLARKASFLGYRPTFLYLGFLLYSNCFLLPNTFKMLKLAYGTPLSPVKLRLARFPFVRSLEHCMPLTLTSLFFVYPIFLLQCPNLSQWFTPFISPAKRFKASRGTRVRYVFIDSQPGGIMFSSLFGKGELN